MLTVACLTVAVTVGQAQENQGDGAVIQTDSSYVEFYPTWSLKNNLLYDATLTPNIGAEVRLGSRSTLQLFYGLNPWKWSDTKKWCHWSLMPEYRYWLNREKAPFRGWFTGVHALGGEFNVCGVKMPFGMMKWLKDNRYEGWYVGGGLTLGHAWRLSDHWRLEAALGIGYIRLKYDQYENEWCGDLVKSDVYHYVGPTKLALNIGYVFGRTKETKIIREVPVIPEAPAPYKPSFALAYMVPKAEQEKARELSGQAYLDFVVNKTDIRPDYRNNAAELRKVEETINVVRRDPNITITHIGIHGYASPEGSYQSNARLAEGRAQAFQRYVQQLIDLPARLFSVESTPEDWQGLIAFLGNPREDLGNPMTDLGQPRMTYENLDAILAIAKGDAAPDEKERQLKQKYPQQWKQLLADVFPGLRHSDYRVSYTIRPFSIDEAKEIIRQKPQQLSLNEMFLVANTYQAGSQDYNDVFETAVRMYPDDETANLNAAVIALGKDDLTAASRYLAKAGNSAQARNARGVLAAKQGRYEEAEAAFRQAAIPEASHNLDELHKVLGLTSH